MDHETGGNILATVVASLIDEHVTGERQARILTALLNELGRSGKWFPGERDFDLYDINLHPWVVESFRRSKEMFDATRNSNSTDSDVLSERGATRNNESATSGRRRSGGRADS